MKEVSLSANDFTASLRPIRNAFIIPHDLPLQFILDSVLPWTSSHWGGGHQFFFPIFSTGENHADFDKWLRLLKKYDPDYIVSIGQFSNQLLDTIKSHTLSTSDWFQFNGTHVPNPNMVRRDFHGTKIEKVIESSKAVLPVDEFQLTGDLDHDIWFFSHYGRLGPFTNISSPQFSVATQTITPRQIESAAQDIAFARFRNNFKTSPLICSMNFLGGRFMSGTQVDYFLPFIVVVGDTAADWALFTSLRRLYNSAFWIKPSLLNASTPGFEWLTYHILSNTDRQDPPLVTSATLTTQNLDALIRNTLSSIGNPHSTIRPARFVSTADFDEIHNWLEWAEINNTTESSLIFDKTKSIQRVPIVGPKHFKPGPTDVKFLSTIYSDTYSYLSHPLTSSPVVAWKNPNAVVTEDVRRCNDGGITFNSVRHLVFGGQDLDSVQHGPKLIRPSIFEDFSSILAQFGLYPRRTIKTLNVSSVLKLWGESTTSFSDDFFRQDTKRIFEIFRVDKKARQNRSTYGLKATAGLEINREFFFSHPLANAFTPALTHFSTDKFNKWIEDGVLVRGERLVCQRCGWAGFYEEKNYSRHFVCQRCSSNWTRNLNTMGNIEPRFLYGLNPLIYGLFDNDSDLTILAMDCLKQQSERYFEAETEIEIVNSSTNRCQMEIDLIANCDGNLVIGECKTSGALNSTQLTTYANFCKQIQANVFCSVSKVAWNTQRKQNITNALSGPHYRPKLHFFSP